MLKIFDCRIAPTLPGLCDVFLYVLLRYAAFSLLCIVSMLRRHKMFRNILPLFYLPVIDNAERF